MAASIPSDVLKLLYGEGLLLNDIAVLIRHAGYNVSDRHLRRTLAKLGLQRRRFSDIADVAAYISNALDGYGSLHGYRFMYERCLANGLRPRKEDVRLLLRALDPEGVNFRKARRLKRRTYFASGPNYIWHIDSYDKLKPYGLCINGCIDGFSRKLLWLNVYYSNSDPQVIGSYYMEAIRRLNGCPLIVRTDPGTENACIRDFQKFLRRDNDPEGHFVYLSGSSTANQRIEAFWGQLRKECIEHWLTNFHELQNYGQYTGDFLDKNLVQMCFTGPLQVRTFMA